MSASWEDAGQITPIHGMYEHVKGIKNHKCKREHDKNWNMLTSFSNLSNSRNILGYPKQTELTQLRYIQG